VASVLISGGSSPVSRSADRSAAVNAIPLFKDGDVSTARSRALI
jgi:hypothetical protein